MTGPYLNDLLDHLTQNVKGNYSSSLLHEHDVSEVIKCLYLGDM